MASGYSTGKCGWGQGGGRHKSTVGQSADSGSVQSPLEGLVRTKARSLQGSAWTSGSSGACLRVGGLPHARHDKRPDIWFLSLTVHAHSPPPHILQKVSLNNLSAQRSTSSSCVGRTRRCTRGRDPAKVPSRPPWAPPPTSRTRAGARRALFLGAACLPAERQISLRARPRPACAAPPPASLGSARPGCRRRRRRRRIPNKERSPRPPPPPPA